VTTSAMTMEEVRRAGLQALVRELGPDGAVRFLRLFDAGSGDYTRDRDELLPRLSVEDIVQRIADERDGQHALRE
jgi:hypothetical protein